MPTSSPQTFSMRALKHKRANRYRLGYQKINGRNMDDVLDAFFKSKGYRDERPLTMEQKRKLNK